MRQEVGLRHPVYTRANEAAPVRAQKLSRVDERSVQGWRRVGVLAVALVRTANSLNVIGRRDAATTQRSRLRNAKTRPRSAATRGRDPVQDPSGEYPFSTSRRLHVSSRRTRSWGKLKRRSYFETSAAMIDCSGTTSVSRKYDSRYCGSSN